MLDRLLNERELISSPAFEISAALPALGTSLLAGARSVLSCCSPCECTGGGTLASSLENVLARTLIGDLVDFVVVLAFLEAPRTVVEVFFLPALSPSDCMLPDHALLIVITGAGGCACAFSSSASATGLSSLVTWLT